MKNNKKTIGLALVGLLSLGSIGNAFAMQPEDVVHSAGTSSVNPTPLLLNATAFNSVAAKSHIKISDCNGNEFSVPRVLAMQCDVFKDHLEEYSSSIHIDLSGIENKNITESAIQLLLKIIVHNADEDELAKLQKNEVKALYEAQRYLGAPISITLKILNVYAKSFPEERENPILKGEILGTLKLWAETICNLGEFNDDEFLNISHQNLETLEVLEHIISKENRDRVKMLDISHNKLTELDLIWLYKLFPQLQILNAENNLIKNVIGSACDKTIVFLNNNRLSNNIQEPAFKTYLGNPCGKINLTTQFGTCATLLAGIALCTYEINIFVNICARIIRSLSPSKVAYIFEFLSELNGAGIIEEPYLYFFKTREYTPIGKFFKKMAEGICHLEKYNQIVLDFTHTHKTKLGCAALASYLFMRHGVPVISDYIMKYQPGLIKADNQKSAENKTDVAFGVNAIRLLQKGGPSFPAQQAHESDLDDEESQDNTSAFDVD